MSEEWRNEECSKRECNGVAFSKHHGKQGVVILCKKHTKVYLKNFGYSDQYIDSKIDRSN